MGTTSAPDDASARALVGHSIALKRGASQVVGRGDDADIRIEDASVSRRHARLILGEHIEVEDLGSTNGTRVRDRTLSEGERVTLAPGDLVEFGGVLCLMRGPSKEATERVEAPLATPSELVVEDPAMRQLHALTARVARATVPVLLLGETGVGKEVFAERLHALAPRASGPYVKVNCGNLTESIVESELFGYEKGAFTGASASRAGLIESAAGGTLFLDEVGELPPAMQTRLLRVLEDREVRRIGASKGRAVDVRFVAATNRDLEAEVAAGRFRADLFYRLNGFVLVIPPLRERVAEVIPLALRFARKARAQLGLAGDAALKTSARAWLEASPVARQHPRAPQRDGARGALRRRRAHRRRAPLGADLALHEARRDARRRGSEAREREAFCGARRRARQDRRRPRAVRRQPDARREAPRHLAQDARLEARAL